MPKVSIRINKKTGNVVTDFEGFQGDACLETAKRMLEGLKARGVNVHVDTFHSKTGTGEANHIFETAKAK
jgi:hypothetical protein